MGQRICEARAALEQSAATEHGVFLRRDVAAAGIGKSKIDRRVRRRQWLVGPGGVTFILAAEAANPLAWLRAANLGLGAVAWGPSALALYDLVDHPLIPVIASKQRCRPSGFVQSTVLDLGKLPTGTRTGIHTLSLEMAIASTASFITTRALEDVVDDALRRQLTTWPRLEESFEQFARPGRKGTRALRSVILDRSVDAVVPLSIWSRDIARKLSRSGLQRPTMEHRVTNQDGSLIAQVDLAYVNAKVAIELDSVAYHLNRQAFEIDRRRDANLARAGWRVLRLTWEQCTTDWPWVVESVRAHLKHAA